MRDSLLREFVSSAGFSWSTLYILPTEITRYIYRLSISMRAIRLAEDAIADAARSREAGMKEIVLV